MKNIIKYIFITTLVIIGLIIIYGEGFGDRNDYTLINKGKPIVFSHRGFVSSNVENSKEAFFKSDSMGFNAIETDISCTKDGKLIIFHDISCKRLLGIDTSINMLNWEDVKQKHLILNGKQTANKILSLDDFLEQTEPSKILYLDIKETTKSIADSLIYILKNHKEFKNIIIADSDLLFLTYMKHKCPNVKVALEGFNKGKEWIYNIIPKKFKPDYYASFLSKVDEKHMDFIKNHNLLKNRIVYGINSSNIQTVFDLGVQNIIIDYESSMDSLDSIEYRLAKTNF